MSLGIVLSGGGVRCVAQLAILDTLYSVGIMPTAYAGSSGGALVASLVLSGNAPAEIIALVESVAVYKHLKPVWLKPGLLEVSAALRVFTDRIKPNFCDLPVSLHIAATEVSDGTFELFSSGSLTNAVLASCCMPVIFSPVLINHKFYIDAGLVNNLPVEPLIGNNCIIGIHTNPIRQGYSNFGMRGMVERSFLLAINGNIAGRRQLCDIYLEPEFLGQYRVFDFSSVREIYDRSKEWIECRVDDLKLDIEKCLSQSGIN